MITETDKKDKRENVVHFFQEFEVLMFGNTVSM